METKELKLKDVMCGDWVDVRNDASPNTPHIEKITPSHLLRDEHWYGIELTSEILEKNGWVRTKYCYGRDCMEIHGADELPEGVDNALSMARWSIDKNYQYHFLDLYMWKGSVMQHNVHYVHQLQHAFRIFGIEEKIVI